MHYRRIAYGLKIDSALPVPDLGAPVDFTGEPDLTIRLGPVVPFRSSVPAGHNRGKWTNHQQFRFCSEDGTYFGVYDGREIVVMPGPRSDPAAIRLYLLGSVCGAMLVQRGFLVLHGNAIRIGDHCLVCVGDQRAGKSTLAAAFMKRGFAVLADDVAAVDEDGRAVPSFPRIKLCDDAADQLGISTAGLSRVMQGMDKFNLPIAGHDPAVRAPIRWVYELTSADVDEVQIEGVTGMHRFDLLRDHTYRGEDFRGEMLARHMDQCRSLAASIHIGRVVRPRRTFSPDLLVDRLLEDIGTDLNVIETRSPVANSSPR